MSKGKTRDIKEGVLGRDQKEEEVNSMDFEPQKSKHGRSRTVSKLQ